MWKTSYCIEWSALQIIGSKNVLWLWQSTRSEFFWMVHLKPIKPYIDPSLMFLHILFLVYLSRWSTSALLFLRSILVCIKRQDFYAMLFEEHKIHWSVSHCLFRPILDTDLFIDDSKQNQNMYHLLLRKNVLILEMSNVKLSLCRYCMSPTKGNAARMM